jgi:hypothetical protein
MRLTYQRSGGFSGLMQTFSLEVESLPPEEAQELETLVESADFFSLPEQIVSDPPGADRFHYTITVETGDRRHRVSAGETALPENLRPLVEKLGKLSRAARYRSNRRVEHNLQPKIDR